MRKPTIIQMLKDLRSKGQSDEEIAAAIGVSWKTLYRWRRPRKDDGVSRPWPEHVDALRKLHERVCQPKTRVKRTIKRPLPPVVPSRIVIDPLPME